MERRLGRGLGSLLGTTAQGEPKKEPNELPLVDVRPNPFQPRIRFDEDAIKELSSWASHGPSAARVDHVDTRWRGYTGEFPEFQIVE